MRENLFKKVLEERILILDGAMGTSLQRFNLSENDYKGELLKEHKFNLKGNNDILSITNPKYIEKIHTQYLEAGADIIETNTFSANSISQADYNTQDFVREINIQSAKIAKKIANNYSTEEKPRFIAGAIGPTNKCASISSDADNPAYRDIDFDTLVNVYSEQIEALIESNSIDIFLVETIFDTLNAKAALYALKKSFKKHNKEYPIMISVTLSDKSGRTLSGQTLEAFLYSIEHANPVSIGLNCGLGIKEMIPYVEELAKISPYKISLYANAGIPNAFGEYDDTPEVMAKGYLELAKQGFVNICGGCCGTTPEHINAIYNTLKEYTPRKTFNTIKRQHFSGLEPFVYNKDINFTVVAERTNITGSPKFARLIRENNWDEALLMALQQVENGANVININMDEGLTNSKEKMVHFLNLIASEPEIAKVPIMIDSSNWDVLIAGLKCIQGKAIVNSISLKEGEKKFKEQALAIRDFGASMIVMAFDENGQADTTDRRIKICERVYKILVEELNIPASEIIFDLNIFPIATGMKEHNDNAVSFIEATKILKQMYPDIMISGGVSNLSFSFRGQNKIREAIHSIFLYHAINAGMEMAIVNAGMIEVYDQIDIELRTLVENLVLNKKETATEELLEYIENHKTTEEKTSITKEQRENIPIEERLQNDLMKGSIEYLESDLEDALKKYKTPIEIIEKPLMSAMDKIGILFGEGKMFLPQVVKSARVMKKAVEILQNKIEENQEKTSTKIGKILLATVKGDVHDIGKNILGVILKCNNFEVIDLGVMVNCQEILEKAREEKVDIIALSGLITPSLQEMIYVAEQMEKEGFTLPALMIGGATTSDLHTALKIAPQYNGIVAHSTNASQAATVAIKIVSKDKDYIEKLKNEQQALIKEYEGK